MIRRLKGRKNILLASIAAIWLAYVGIISAEYYFNISYRVGRVVEERKKDVDFVLEFAGNLLIKGQMESLIERLKQAREFKMVDFYILQKDQQVLTFYNKQNNPDELTQRNGDFNTFVESEGVTYKIIQIYDYRLMVGVNTSRKSLSRVALGEQKYLILHNFAIASLFAFVLFALVYKDALKWSSFYYRGGPMDETSQASGSLKLAKSAPETGLQLSTAQSERFESTLVRVDLCLSTLKSLSSSVHCSEILQRYRYAAYELVARYGGVLCPSAGTEILFYIKGLSRRSGPLAVSCVRSLFELAEEIEKTLPLQSGAEFKLQAALDNGLLHVNSSNKSAGMSGEAFIRTWHLLAHSHGTEGRSSLGVSDTLLGSVKNIGRWGEIKTGLFLLEEFYSIESFLDQDKVDVLDFYRSDLNLMQILRYMESLVEKQKDDLFLSVFANLKHVKTHVICRDLEFAFTHFLEFTYRKSHDHPVAPKILSAAVSLTGNLIPPGGGSEKLTEILKLYLEFSDTRVQANAVSALGDVPGNVRFLRKFIHSDQNRLSADALVVTGKQVVDKELVKRVQGLLRSSDKVHQASGRYVALKLVEHYKQHDLLYYNTNPHLKKLEELLGKAA